MKFFGKIFSVLLAVAALSFGFSSCSDDEEDLKVVATYYGVATGNLDDVPMIVKSTVRFYNSNEYTNDIDMTAVAGATVFSYTGTMELGTYTGDPTKDGTVKMTATKEYDFDAKKLVDIASADRTTEDVVISGGKVTEEDIFDDGTGITLEKQ
ncbi:MAG: hypothetical protein IJ717_12330 [Treponema sp.]|nr:hypothetical protein [Treponema sp.]